MTPKERGQVFLEQLRAQGYPGEVGLHVSTLDGQLLATLNADTVFPAASTIKVPLLLLALERIQSGELNLKERFELHAEDQVNGAGVLHELGAGLRPSLQDLLTLMIIVSDNTATNLVIGRLGVEAVNAWLDEQGCPHTRLIGKLQLPPGQHNPAQRRGERNRTTASEQARLLLGLWNGKRLDSVHRELALSILGRQQYRDILARPMPKDAQGEPLYPTYTKSGELSGVHHDVGLLLLPSGLCVALLSRGGSDLTGHPDNRDAIALSDTLYPLLAALGGVYEWVGGDI
ncbi:serine hydrolase [Deinococcus rubellus]|uniref:Class A beta-lactamase-related serine hydrolase n=1 Tax=Deinococcus rubellus TaxID=1889240 RepID=A0ABY5YI30_9DEIO|nr:serine hydrolase [Deinococcus rubellus]UWX64586.1 class A beta-lactamase-related serine hydrolase [Deinococcus rubellus]